MNPGERQEFMRIARRLIEAGAYLKREQKCFGWIVKPNRWAKAVMKCSEQYVEKVVSEDLLHPDTSEDEKYVISDPGRSFYLRGKTPSHAFLAQHHQLETQDDGVILKNAQTPLACLKSRNGRNQKGAVVFEDVEFTAGERLCRDFELSQSNKSITLDLSRVSVQDGRRAGHEYSDAPGAVLDARKRLRKAVEAVGQDLDEVLITTCCLNVGLVEMEKKLGWPNRSGKLVLKIALRRLAQHYGYLPATRASASARILETIA